LKYLIDTNVLSQVCGMFLSVLTIGEIRKGIEKPFAMALEAWLLRVLKSYRDRILVIVPDPLPIIDGLIAATAKVHRLTLVTRNTSDFIRTGVHSLNPFAT
jgi:hypothetical protein